MADKDKEKYVVVQPTERGKKTLEALTGKYEAPDDQVRDGDLANFLKLRAAADREIQKPTTESEPCKKLKKALKTLPDHVEIYDFYFDPKAERKPEGSGYFIVDLSKDKEGKETKDYGGKWLCTFERSDSTHSYINMRNLTVFDPKLAANPITVKQCPPKFGVMLDRAQDAIIEHTDPANVKSFDLPRNKPIGYISFDGMECQTDTILFSNSKEIQYALPEAMVAAGYQMVTENNERKVTPKKKEDIEKHIKALYDAGIRDFYLSFNAHGNSHETTFSWDEKGEKKETTINSNEMRDLLEKYDDCTFAIQTISCRGGGMIRAMEIFDDKKDAPKNRVALFTMTKQDSENFDDVCYYQRQMLMQLKAMQDKSKGAPKTYGEAHLCADKNSKSTRITTFNQGVQYQDVNPEAWLSQPGAPCKRTSMLTPKNKSDPLLKSLELFHAGYSPTANPHTDHCLSHIPWKKGNSISTPEI